jgi:hypothetical protein
VVRYATSVEKAGIPAVALGFPDQINFARNVALVQGVPELRWVDVARTGSGDERAKACIENVIKALTNPLTAKEKEAGLYTPPPPPKFIFEGTLTDAQVFLQQTTPINNCRNCPIAKYTDGLPVIIPTEENVKEMLTGTSRKPTEQIFTYSMNASVPGGFAKSASPRLYSSAYAVTVEKAAITAVMAGCKPEYMPVVLAIAAAGGGSSSCPGTSGPMGFIYFVSGPIAKEIGMNPGQNSMDNGSPANRTLGRVGGLMTVTFGGCITGQVRTDSGGPINNIAIPEDDDGLPPGWETMREEAKYSKTQNALFRLSVQRPSWGQFAPSSFRGLIADGVGGMARALGVEGKKGPHNFLEYLVPTTKTIGANTVNGAVTLIMHPGMAISLYDYGFKTKAAAYQWLWDKNWITVGELEKLGWYDHRTQAGEGTEPLSGKKYKDLPDDTLLHIFGVRGPTENCIVVACGFADEICYTIQGEGKPSASPIDVWK